MISKDEMSYLGMGCVHPKGENEHYDGLYYKQSEMSELAQDLVGKPLFIEHMDDEVGTIKHAWVGQNNECFAIFETACNFPGYLAESLIQNEICTDLSLGHQVEIDSSQHRVINKQAIEVSICEKGARPNTHIYAFEKNVPFTNAANNKNYIIEMKSSILKMSSPTTQPDKEMAVDTKPVVEQKKETETDSKETTRKNPMVTEFDEMFKQLKEQAAQFEALKMKFNQSEEARASAETKLAESNKRKREKREKVIDGTLKKFIGEMVNNYKDLSPYASDLEKVLSAMKNNESSEPMVQLLACTASSHGKNAEELEKSYQESKQLKEKLDELKRQLKKVTTPAFSSPTERFVNVKASVVSDSAASQPAKRARSLPPGISLPRRGIAGMQSHNPDMWAQMIEGGSSSTTGMGWFNETNLVGKEYKQGRRPKRLND